jgi:2-C-methyl-D-erythritol 2,4-cyclodiphosphate synthase
LLKIKSGIGYDIHRLEAGSGLFIGGVKVSNRLKFSAHSDGDVLIHALIDSLLGALGEPDIGEHFPDTDPQFRDISSVVLLQKTYKIVKEKKYEIINIDCVVIAERPKISPYKKNIRSRLSSLLGMSEQDINVKAKTKEKVDAVGRGEAVECFCVCMIRSII